jgi:hypothetical protein
VGVAPESDLPVRVLNNQGSGSFSSIVCGIDGSQPTLMVNIKVANMSLGSRHRRWHQKQQQ